QLFQQAEHVRLCRRDLLDGLEKPVSYDERLHLEAGARRALDAPAAPRVNEQLPSEYVQPRPRRPAVVVEPRRGLERPGEDLTRHVGGEVGATGAPPVEREHLALV